jgi:hypothetical protein
MENEQNWRSELALHGGKAPSWLTDRMRKLSKEVAYPVNRESYDEVIGILKETVQQAKIGDKEKMGSLKRLRRLLPENANS